MFNLTRGEELTALIAVALVGLATAVVCLVRGDRGKTIKIPLNKRGEVAVQRKGGSQGKIMVHVSGEVRKKGVLPLSNGSRVRDAVALAVPTENADLEALNLAAHLLDGEHIVVPRKGMTTRSGKTLRRAGAATKLNINTASRQQLESLPGIGPVIAGRIIEFRSQRKFINVDDLVRVKGIGPATLEKLMEYVCVK